MTQSNQYNLIISLLVSIFFFIPKPAVAEFSIESYCQVTIKTMQQQITQTREIISIVDENKNDPVKMSQQLESKRSEFDQAREALYSSYETNALEFVTYMNRNKKSVDAYLVSNSDIKQQIDDLAAELKTLLDEEDTLRQDIENREEPPPLQE